MKQLALAGLMYASDNGERAPLEGEWVDALYPYAKSMIPFVCAELPPDSSGTARYGHALFVGIVGQRLNKLFRPESFPFFFDSKDLSKNAVSDLHYMQARGQRAGISIAYADGHARVFRPGQGNL